MSLTTPRRLHRVITRVCTKCRERKRLQHFYERDTLTHRYGSVCDACRPAVKAPRTKVCRKCRLRKYLSEFTTHNCSRDGLEYRCKSCIRAYNRSRYRKAGGACLECGKSSHFRRCESCRATRQASLEHELAAQPKAGPGQCGLPIRRDWCHETLQFGVNRLGRTTMWCVVHGERLMPVMGVRHYDQRFELEGELSDSLVRVSRVPQPNATAGQNGRKFRERSNEYGRGAA